MEFFDLGALTGAAPPGAFNALASSLATHNGYVRIPGAMPGCYAIANLSDRDYHEVMEGVSTSGLKAILRSGAHYQAYKRNGGEETPSRRFGRAAHAWVLEPNIFWDKFAIWNGGRRQGHDFDDFVATHPNKTILTADELVRVKGAGEAIMSNEDFPLRAYLFDEPDPKVTVREFSIFWEDPVTKVKMKARLDAGRLAAPLASAFDLKTTDDAREHAFMRQVFDLHYDMQAAVYMEALLHFTGKYGPFIIGAVEAKDPHGSNFFGLDPEGDDIVENGRKKMRAALRRYAECMNSGKWPSYPNRGLIKPTMHHWHQFYDSDEADSKGQASKPETSPSAEAVSL